MAGMTLTVTLPEARNFVLSLLSLIQCSGNDKKLAQFWVGGLPKDRNDDSVYLSLLGQKVVSTLAAISGNDSGVNKMSMAQFEGYVTRTYQLLEFFDEVPGVEWRHKW